MCLHEIRIKNRSKSYTKGCTKYKINVPCGHCDDCRLRKEDDWKLRIWQEIKDFNESGGKVVFVSFTYSEEHCPWFRIEKRDGSFKYIRVFNKLHKTKYLVDLRNYMYSHYGLVGEYNEKYKYDDFDQKQSELFKLVAELKDVRSRITKIGWKSKKSESLKLLRDELKEKIKSYPPHLKNGILIRNCERPFRMIWCSEFGTSDNQYIADNGSIRTPTKRPHYHCLFFVPKEWLSLPDFENVEKIKSFFSKFWHYGLILWSDEKKNKPNPIFVQDEFAGIYVSKYCFKDVDFYNNKDLLEYLYDEDHKRIESHYEAIKDYLPRHWQSESFGVGLTKYYDSYEAMDEGVDFHFKSDLEKGRSIKYRAPQYIERKLYYNQLPDGRYKLNEKGIDLMVKLYPNKKDRFIKNLRYALSLKGIEHYVEESDVKTLGIDGSNRLEVYTNLQEVLKRISLNTIANYHFVWRGLFVEKPLGYRNYPNEFRFLDNLSEEEFDRVSMEQYYQNLIAFQLYDAWDDEGYFSKIKPIDEDRFRYYSGCIRFDGAEYILLAVQRMRQCYMKKSREQYLKDREYHSKFNINIA